MSERLAQCEIKKKIDIVPSYTLTPEKIVERTGGVILPKDEAQTVDTQIVYPYNAELSMGDFDVIIRNGIRPHHAFYLQAESGEKSILLSLRETAAICEEASITYVSPPRTKVIDNKAIQFVKWLRLSKDKGYVHGDEDISSVSVWMRNAAYLAATLPRQATV